LPHYYITLNECKRGGGFMKKASFILLAAAFAFLASSALAKYDSPEERQATHDEIKALREQIKDLPSCNDPNKPSSPTCKAEKDALKAQIANIRASAHQ
jgi:hypothetical protein